MKTVFSVDAKQLDVPELLLASCNLLIKNEKEIVEETLN